MTMSNITAKPNQADFVKQQTHIEPIPEAFIAVVYGLCGPALLLLAQAVHVLKRPHFGISSGRSNLD